MKSVIRCLAAAMNGVLHLKRSWRRITVVLLAIGCSSTLLPVYASETGVSRAPTAKAPWRSLWNGKDLAGWSTWLDRPESRSHVLGLAKSAEGRYLEPLGSGRDPLAVFTVVADVDGRPAIRISGEVFGELRTLESFKNYHLRLQFKWGEKKWPPRDGPDSPRDSGLLYHVHSAPGAEGRTWARSIELQIQERDVGDLFAVGSAIAVRATPRRGSGLPLFVYDPGGPWRYFSQVPGSDGRVVKELDYEKPTGEWNTVELICLGDQSIHIVNGQVVMRLSDPRRIDAEKPLPISSGPILLQSEGAEVFYRDIEIRSITAIPEAFAPSSKRLDDPSAWRGWKSPHFPDGWRAAHGTFSKEGVVEDLVTREVFGNFELELEWQISQGGNAGIFYRATREHAHIFDSAPEYQLLDDAHAPDGGNRLTAAAAAYALYPSLAGVVKPAGEWNTTRIVVKGAHIEHWLNGQKVVAYELWSPDWYAKVAASKFAAFPHYGRAARGYIGIQGDHAGTLAVRHLRIRQVP